MMLRVCLAFVFLLVTHFCFSQNFRPGYVRLKGGQDQMGLIGEIRPGIPESIQYKASDSATLVFYKASEVEGYGITDGVYFTSFRNPSRNPNDWSFVELLVQGGEMTLIRRNNMYFVLMRGSNEFSHLDNKYRHLLSSLMANCPWVAAKSGRIKLNKTALTEHVKAYNECVAIKNPNFDGVQRPVTIGLVIGLDNSTATFSDAAPYATRYLAMEPLRDKAFVQGGIDVVLKSYRVSNFVGAYAGILYNSNRYQKVSKVVTPAATEVNEYSINSTQLKFPIGFELSPPSKKRMSFHVRVGAVVPLQLKLTATHPSYTIEPKTSGAVYYEDPGALTAFKNKIMFMGAFGFDCKVSTISKIRVQFSFSSGSVAATAKDDTDTISTIKGKIISLNVMTGFIF